MTRTRIWAILSLLTWVFFVLVTFNLPSSEAAGGSAAAILQQLARERADKAVKIVDPTNEMRWFYQSLAMTAAKTPNSLTRVCHYGDSIIEMDLMSGQMRRRMQQKWGDGGHGFVVAGRPKPWYRPYDLDFDPSSKLITFDLRDSNVADRRMGLGGVYGVSYKPKATLTLATPKRAPVGTSVSRFEILYPIEANGGTIEVNVDGNYMGKIISRGAQPKDAYTEILVADGRHELELKIVEQNVRVYGVILERQGPGVVYDSLGINGIGLNYYLKINREHWQNQLRHRKPNLVILGFGHNDARAPQGINEQVYRNEYLQAAKMVKEALPNTSVLIMGPIDQAIKQGANLVTNPTILKVMEIQKSVAKELGLAFWSPFEAMGGSGTFVRWYQSNPRLGSGDLGHPTPEGGVVLGDLWYTALMQGFADYLQAGGMPASAPPAYSSALSKLNLVK